MNNIGNPVVAPNAKSRVEPANVQPVTEQIAKAAPQPRKVGEFFGKAGV